MNVALSGSIIYETKWCSNDHRLIEWIIVTRFRWGHRWPMAFSDIIQMISVTVLHNCFSRNLYLTVWNSSFRNLYFLFSRAMNFFLVLFVFVLFPFLTCRVAFFELGVNDEQRGRRLRGRSIYSCLFMLSVLLLVTFRLDTIWSTSVENGLRGRVKSFHLECFISEAVSGFYFRAFPRDVPIAAESWRRIRERRDALAIVRSIWVNIVGHSGILRITRNMSTYLLLIIIRTIFVSNI